MQARRTAFKALGGTVVSLGASSKLRGMILLVIGLFFAVTTLLIWIVQRAKPQPVAVEMGGEYSVVAFVMLLRSAYDYADLFESLAQKTSFDSLNDRELMSHRLVDSISFEDLIRISSRTIARGVDLFELNRIAFESFKLESSSLGIDEAVFNARDPDFARCCTSGLPAKPDSVCLFGITVLSPSFPDEAEAMDTPLALFRRRLAPGLQDDRIAVYFYFAPVPGRRLDEEQGRELFDRVASGQP